MIYYRKLFKEFKNIMKKVNILILKRCFNLGTILFKVNMKINSINLIIFVLLITYIMIILSF